jgi:small subunit ribosomal protein S1
VWPDLSPDIDAVLKAFPAEDLIELVWMDRHGQVTGRLVDDEGFKELPALLADAQAAMFLPIAEDDRRPLLTAVLPDADGVLRARWTP